MSEEDMKKRTKHFALNIGWNFLLKAVLYKLML